MRPVNVRARLEPLRLFARVGGLCHSLFPLLPLIGCAREKEDSIRRLTKKDIPCVRTKAIQGISQKNSPLAC